MLEPKVFKQLGIGKVVVKVYVACSGTLAEQRQLWSKTILSPLILNEPFGQICHLQVKRHIAHEEVYLLHLPDGWKHVRMVTEHVLNDN